MTQATHLPSPGPEDKAGPPEYNDNEVDATRASRFSEKGTPVCPKHNPSSTHHLDAHLSTPSAQAAAHTVITAIDSATDGAHCTRCTANEAAKTLTRYLFELRQAKKGGMSKEEKKAAKAELKGLMREVKGVVREEKGRLRREAGRS